jgi:hypothetical protein
MSYCHRQENPGPGDAEETRYAVLYYYELEEANLHVQVGFKLEINSATVML